MTALIGAGAPPRRRTGPSPARRALHWAGGILVVLALAAGWLAYRGLALRSNLAAARTELAAAKADLLHDGRGAGPLVREAQAHTRAALAAGDDPLWSLASRIPVLGNSLRAATGIAQVSNGLAQQALPTLVGAVDRLHGLLSTPGSGIPLGAVSRLAGPLSGVAAQLDADVYALSHEPTADVLAQVTGADASLLADVRSLAGPVRTAATAARLGPAMLGADGPRRYLVAFENPAEARPDGGNIGGFAEIVADRGRLAVVRFGPNGELPQLRRRPATLDPTFLAGYAQYGAGLLWTNTNLSPNFPDDAAAWADMYQAGTGRHVDGVISVDPVALAELAGITGGALDVPGAGAVQPAQIPAFLESREYALGLTRHARQQLVAQVGRLALQRVMGTHVSARSLLTTLGHLAGQGHVHLASTHPGEEAQIAGFPVAGAVPGTRGPFAAAYVTNAAGTKLDYYLHESVAYRAERCTPGASRATITVRLTNAVPKGPLPSEVTLRVDHPRGKLPLGQNRVALTVLGATGARWQGGSVDGAPLVSLADSPAGARLPAGAVTATKSYLAGHPAWTLFLELPPRSTTVVVVHLAGTGSGRPVVASQPLPQPVAVSVAGCG